MANSKYEYVKTFEHDPTLLPQTFAVLRLDGRGFHRLSKKYNFARPVDRRGIDLMNEAALMTMVEFPDIQLAYGISDEFSFVFDRSMALFGRRESKILSTVTSTFTSAYTYLWPKHFPHNPLTIPLPSFDARIVLYPTQDIIRDYLNWRQVDCHINNLYNTTFWALCDRAQMGPREAEQRLKGTFARDKNEILYKEFGINYNSEPEMNRKGSVLWRLPDQTVPEIEIPFTTAAAELMGGHIGTEDSEARSRERKKGRLALGYCDLIKNGFWLQRPYLLPQVG